MNKSHVSHGPIVIGLCALAFSESGSEWGCQVIMRLLHLEARCLQVNITVVMLPWQHQCTAIEGMTETL